MITPVGNESLAPVFMSKGQPWRGKTGLTPMPSKYTAAVTGLPVPIATGCFYELPPQVNTAQLKDLETYFRIRFVNFVVRRGRRVFFNFATASDRDSFLSMLERSLWAHGEVCERAYLDRI